VNKPIRLLGFSYVPQSGCGQSSFSAGASGSYFGTGTKFDVYKQVGNSGDKVKYSSEDILPEKDWERKEDSSDSSRVNLNKPFTIRPHVWVTVGCTNGPNYNIFVNKQQECCCCVGHYCW
jgi:hypothetical protein